MCHNLVDELAGNEKTPSFTYCACSTFKKVCAKSNSFGNQPSMVSQRALILFQVSDKPRPPARCWFHPLTPPHSRLVFAFFQTCRRNSKASALAGSLI